MTCGLTLVPWFFLSLLLYTIIRIFYVFYYIGNSLRTFRDNMLGVVFNGRSYTYAVNGDITDYDFVSCW